MLGAALAVGLALLLPAAAPAVRAGTAPADPAFVQYLDDVRDGIRGGALGLVPEPVSWTGVPSTRFAPLMARFPDRFTPASPAAATFPLAAAESAGVQTGRHAGGLRPPDRRQALPGPRPGPVRDLLGLRRSCLARIEPPARRRERLLREQPGS